MEVMLLPGSPSLLSLPSHTTWDQSQEWLSLQPYRAGFSQICHWSGNAPWTCYRPLWCQHLLSWSLLFTADSNLYHADIKANLYSTLCSVGRRAGVFPLLLILMDHYGLCAYETVLRHHLLYTQHCILNFKKVAISIVYENTLNAGSFYFHA